MFALTVKQRLLRWLHRGVLRMQGEDAGVPAGGQTIRVGIKNVYGAADARGSFMTTGRHISYSWVVRI
jgi:hypothetical protein